MRNIESPIACVQHAIIQSKLKQANTLSFFNQLTDYDIFDVLEAHLPEHRERLFPPTETLSMFLNQALSKDSSCQKAVNDSAVMRMNQQLPLCSTTTGAYCKARKRLPTQLIQQLTQHTGQLLHQHTDATWRWKGRHIKLVDGTTVTMPDTLDNQNTYPQQGAQKPGLGFPICRIVGISCLASGALLNANIGRFNGKGGSEQNILREMLNSLNKKDLLIGDAFNGTYSLLCALQHQGVDFLFEKMGQRKRCTDFSEGKPLGSRDHIQTINKPKVRPNWMDEKTFSELPEFICVRELKVDDKVLITSLACPKQHSKDELKQLYRQRWNIELDIRDIKTTMGMEKLTCKTPEMNEKEMWVYFLAYNLIRLAMTRSAEKVNLKPRDVSFKHSLQICLSGISLQTSEASSLLTLISQNTVGKRPGRVEPRAVKGRPKPLPLLTKPRHEARREILEKGHPKKLK